MISGGCGALSGLMLTIVGCENLEAEPLKAEIAMLVEDFPCM